MRQSRFAFGPSIPSTGKRRIPPLFLFKLSAKNRDGLSRFFLESRLPAPAYRGKHPQPRQPIPREEAKSALPLPERRTALTTCETHKRCIQVDVRIGRSSRNRNSEHSFSSRAQCRALSPFVSLFMVIFIKIGCSRIPSPARIKFYHRSGL